MKTLIVAVLMLLVSVSYAQQPIAIVGGTLIDGTWGAPIQNSVVIIQGTKIIAVGTNENTRIPDGAQVIDARGKYIMPGLIDCHVHYEQPRDLVQMLAWGVTSVNCMFESTDQALEMERRTANDTIHSPQIYATAPIFTAKGGWWDEGFPIDSSINRFPATPEEAREAVRKVKAKGIKRIKLMYDDMGWCRDTLQRLKKMDKNVMAALVNEAEKQDLLCEVHAPQLSDAKQVIDVEANPRGLAFVHGITDQSMASFSGSSTTVGDKLLGYHLWYVSTFCVFEFLADTRGFMKSVLDDERFRTALPADVVRRYASEEYYRQYQERYPNITYLRSHLPLLRENLKRQIGFSETIPLGTDMWALPGIAVHLELEYVVQAGMPPNLAVIAATNQAANFLGEGRRKKIKPAKLSGVEKKINRDSSRVEHGKIGTIEVSKQADLLILEANPLEDIRNTRSVRTIIKHGKIFGHQRLIEESKLMK